MSTLSLSTQLAEARRKFDSLKNEIDDVTERANIASSRANDEKTRRQYITEQIKQKTEEVMTGNVGNRLAQAERKYDVFDENNLTEEEMSSHRAKLTRVNTDLRNKIKKIIRPLTEKLTRAVKNLDKQRKIFDKLADYRVILIDKIYNIEKKIHTLAAQELAANQGQAVPAVTAVTAVTAVPARTTRRTRTGRGRKLRRSTHKPKKM